MQGQLRFDTNHCDLYEVLKRRKGKDEQRRCGLERGVESTSWCESESEQHNTFRRSSQPSLLTFQIVKKFRWYYKILEFVERQRPSFGEEERSTLHCSALQTLLDNGIRIERGSQPSRRHSKRIQHLKKLQSLSREAEGSCTWLNQVTWSQNLREMAQGMSNVE